MIDWAILIGGIVGFILILWRGYRWLRQEPEPEREEIWNEATSPSVFNEAARNAMAATDPLTSTGVHFIPSPSAEEIARRVHDHERACERKERAEALLQAVTMGHKPDEDEIKSLYEYHCGHEVSTALALGAWSSTMKAIEDLTRDLEDLKAAQPTLIVAEMPERVG